MGLHQCCGCPVLCCGSQAGLSDSGPFFSRRGACISGGVFSFAADEYLQRPSLRCGSQSRRQDPCSRNLPVRRRGGVHFGVCCPGVCVRGAQKTGKNFRRSSLFPVDDGKRTGWMMPQAFRQLITLGGGFGRRVDSGWLRGRRAGRCSFAASCWRRRDRGGTTSDRCG